MFQPSKPQKKRKKKYEDIIAAYEKKRGNKSGKPKGMTSGNRLYVPKGK